MKHSFIHKLLSLVVAIAFFGGNVSFARDSSIPYEVNLRPQLDSKLAKIDDELTRDSLILEEKLAQAGHVYQDPELEAYLNSLFDHETLRVSMSQFQFRIKILKNPVPNATAHPSGNIYFRTGLISALENEDQLRFVVAHEAMHIIGKHSVYFSKKYRDQTTLLKLLDIAIVPVASMVNFYTGFQYSGVVSGVSQGVALSAGVIYLASVTGFGRGAEIEADEYAHQVLGRYGTDTRQGIRVFEILADIKERYFDGHVATHLFATHESDKNRIKRTIKYLPELEQDNDIKIGETIDAEFVKRTADLRKFNIALNIKIGWTQKALDNLALLEKAGIEDADTLYLKGEAYRRRSDDRDLLKDELNRKEWNKIRKEMKEEEHIAQWQEQAIQYFKNSIQYNSLYANPYRGLALLKEGDDDYEGALSNYQQYLVLSPNAKDARFIQAKMKRMEKKITQAQSLEGEVVT